MDGLFLKKVSADSFSSMVRPVTDEEVKAAMFSIGDERAPGPDGFSSAFFKKGWDIVGLDVCHAIRDFFVNGWQIIEGVHSNFIALIHNDSARVIMESLDEFKLTSGLVPSIPKSTAFFFPLISSRLLNKDCKVLVDKDKNRIEDWRTSSLFLCLIRGFLWCNGEYKRGKAKVAWDDICLPKSEGGLGLRSLDLFNMA
ncbi:hypothetical protein Tco_0303918 [Tanacetum coccineum]